MCSVDGLLGEEEKALLKRLVMKLSSKWKMTYGMVMSFVNSRIRVAIARASHMSLRGLRVPIYNVSWRRFQIEYGAGMLLYNQFL